MKHNMSEIIFYIIVQCWTDQIEQITLWDWAFQSALQAIPTQVYSFVNLTLRWNASILYILYKS